MIGELVKSEISELKSTGLENFRNIKPEKAMSANEIKGAVKTEFDKSSKEAESQENKDYLDDNGNKYRVGDNLIPNNEFKVNDYKYKTDDKGRVVSAEGKLQIKDHDGRNEMDSRAAVDKGDMRKSDDRGHLIADRFNGSGGIENLVPMDSELNQHGDYNKMENTLADAMNNGAKVELKVEPIYQNDSTRPSEFRVTYSIDNDKTMSVFKNESEVKS